LKKKSRLAVATIGKAGLKDSVSEVFGKAKTFTIVDVENGNKRTPEIIENPAVSYEHGAGPIAVKELIDKGVTLVVSSELGPGASSILQHHGISVFMVEAGTEVTKAIENALRAARK
jgi:predicted Fe-Mo cluster-binding NifX family protein